MPTARPLFGASQVVVGPRVVVRLQRTVLPRLKVMRPGGRRVAVADEDGLREGLAVDLSLSGSVNWSGAMSFPVPVSWMGCGLL